MQTIRTYHRTQPELGRRRRNPLLLALVAAWVAIALAIGSAGVDQASGIDTANAVEAAGQR